MLANGNGLLKRSELPTPAVSQALEDSVSVELNLSFENARNRIRQELAEIDKRFSERLRDISLEIEPVDVPSENESITSMSSTMIHVSREFQTTNTRPAVSKLYAKLGTLEAENAKVKQRLSMLEKGYPTEKVSNRPKNRDPKNEMAPERRSHKLKIFDEGNMKKLLEEKESFYINENDRLRKIIMQLRSSQEDPSPTINQSDFTKISSELDDLRNRFNALNLEKLEYEDQLELFEHQCRTQKNTIEFYTRELNDQRAINEQLNVKLTNVAKDLRTYYDEILARELKTLKDSSLVDIEKMRQIAQKLHEKELQLLRKAREDTLVQLEQTRAAHLQMESQYRESQEKLSHTLKETDSKVMEHLLSLKMREFENAQLREMLEDLRNQLEKHRQEDQQRSLDPSSIDYSLFKNLEQKYVTVQRELENEKEKNSTHLLELERAKKIISMVQQPKACLIALIREKENEIEELKRRLSSKS